jgi:hypothetical protein
MAYRRGMASRRVLTGVAESTARAFSSRNNDLDGWWVPGLLLDAMPAADPDYALDLLSGVATPEPSEAGLRLLGPAWARYLVWLLDRYGVARRYVESANLSMRFDRTRLVHSHIYEVHARPLDHPFTCRVEITDDRGRIHARSVDGHCGRLAVFIDPNPYNRPCQSASGPGPRVLEDIEPRSSES